MENEKETSRRSVIRAVAAGVAVGAGGLAASGAAAASPPETVTREEVLTHGATPVDEDDDCTIYADCTSEWCDTETYWWFKMRCCGDDPHDPCRIIESECRCDYPIE